MLLAILILVILASALPVLTSGDKVFEADMRKEAERNTQASKARRLP